MDDKTSVLLGELSRLGRRFENIEALAPNCVLKTERKRILSRFQVRRTVPVHAPIPEMDLPAGYSEITIPGNGCEVLPERISSFDELESAIVLYHANGQPCVTANGEPMYKTAGWEVRHLVSIRGRDGDAVTKVFKAINHWCFINHNLLRSIGLLPPVAVVDEYSMLWPDIVLALAEQSTNKPRWFISVNANMKIELSAWKNKNHRRQLKEFNDSPWGVTNELMALIGDDPEDLHATLEDFIAESVTAIESLMKLVLSKSIETTSTCADTKQPVAPIYEQPATPERENDLEDGLYRFKKLFVWNGKYYRELTDQMMIALELLERAYADDRKVTPDEMRGKLGEIPMDGFKRIFRINRVMEKAISHEVTEIIGGRAPKGWYLAKKNPEIITGCNRL